MEAPLRVPAASEVAVKMPVLSTEIEEQLVDWFRDNALLYDKWSPDYKNRMKRESLVAEMGIKLRLSESFVSHWLHAMRTQFGKLRKQGKSGQMTELFTTRQQGTLRSFSFLDVQQRVQSSSLMLGMVSIFLFTL